MTYEIGKPQRLENGAEAIIDADNGAGVTVRYVGRWRLDVTDPWKGASWDAAGRHWVNRSGALDLIPPTPAVSDAVWDAFNGSDLALGMRGALERAIAAYRAEWTIPEPDDEAIEVAWMAWRMADGKESAMRAAIRAAFASMRERAK